MICCISYVRTQPTRSILYVVPEKKSKTVITTAQKKISPPCSCMTSKAQANQIVGTQTTVGREFSFFNQT